jgi:hypothetical protein
MGPVATTVIASFIGSDGICGTGTPDLEADWLIKSSLLKMLYRKY